MAAPLGQTGAMTCITLCSFIKLAQSCLVCNGWTDKLELSHSFVHFVVKKLYSTSPLVRNLRCNEGRCFTPPFHPGMLIRRVVNMSLGVLIGYLSIPVVMNLLSSTQVMNTSFDPLRIVNTYGAFGRYSNGSQGS